MIRHPKYDLELCLIAFAATTLIYSQTAPKPPVDLTAVTAAHALPDGVQIQAGPAQMRITALRDDIVRIRVADGVQLPEDASWAVLPASRESAVNVQPQEDVNSVGFRTAALDVRVERKPLRVVISDLHGHVLCSDAVGRPVEFRDGGFSVYKQMPDDEQFYGLGDKLGTFNRRNQAYTLWNTDVGPQEATDPIYKSIPFFIAITGGQSYGLFLDNTWRTWFDFGKEARDAYAFGAEGGPLDYYFLYGPSTKKVVEDYAFLTGKPPLPPMWALGFQQSRYSYSPESDVRRVANRLRADKIPSDVLYLDIDYQYRNRPFTVDPVRFPNFPGLVGDLRKQHFHLVLITDLHIAHLPNQGYLPYDTGHAGDNFVKNPDGSEFVGVVWPGPAVFPDFTREKTREWWGGLYRQFVKDGVAGFWNDMNEPSVFDGPDKTMPLDTVHRIEEPGFNTRTATHREIHNIVGMENERATFDGLLKLRPNDRPFVLTRATYAGGQRFGFTWTGDNSATWNHLRLSTQQLLNLGMSGISMVGDDIGGFNGSPSADLLTRWVEVGAFNPMYRDHSTKGSLPQEVWVNGPQQEAIRRRYIDTRYRLLTYIYTLADEAHRTGLPLVRPLFMEFPNYFDASDSEFLLGRDLLIAPPPFGEMRDAYAVSYPPGTWFDFWTGEKMPPQREGPDIVQVAEAVAKGESLSKFPEPYKIHPDLATLPVYVRGGSIVPMQPLIQSTDETPSGPLELRVYPGADCHGTLYQDDGHTFAYEHGVFLRQSFTCAQQGGGVTVDFSPRQGTWQPWWKQVEVVVYGWHSAAAHARWSGSAQAPHTRYDAAQHALHVVVPDAPGAAQLQVTP